MFYDLCTLRGNGPCKLSHLAQGLLAASIGLGLRCVALYFINLRLEIGQVLLELAHLNICVFVLRRTIGRHVLIGVLQLFKPNALISNHCLSMFQAAVIA